MMYNQKSTIYTPGLISEKYRFLSGSALKLIAAVTMLIDHTAAILLNKTEIPLFSFAGHTLTLYGLMRYVGRIAFPIFCFLLIEGFLHTHDRKAYGRNLFLFALISEIPWNLVHSGKLTGPNSQNVFFTLFLGYLGISVVEKAVFFPTAESKDENPPEQRKMLLYSGMLLLLLLLSVLIRCDYGCSGFGFIILMYILRTSPLLRAVVGSCVLSARWLAGLAFIPIAFYNGKRGFIRGKAAKYIFYAFYPVHLLVLYLIRHRIFGY